MATLPETFTLHGAYPNPFNPTTVIGFDVPAAEKVRIDVYDIGGRLVAVLTNRRYQPGSHQVSFRADRLASGIYLVRSQYGSLSETQKITLVK